MSKHLPPSPNHRCLKNLSKRLLKLWMNFDPEAISQLRRLHPSFERLTDEQLVSKMNLHNAQLSMTREYGFQNWRDICGAIEAMKLADLSKLTGDQITSMLVATGNARGAGTALSHGSRSEKLAKYEQGRPYRENGALYISKKHGLTLEEALNDTARIHDMPPVGTCYLNSYGLEWAVENYAYFVAPTTMARYPGDCDYLPVVYPQNPSRLLQNFISEVDHCTTKWILLLDTMPAVHPLGLGNQIHCSHLSGDPTEAHIFLDVKHAHETIIAHELAHLWFSFVEDGDGGHILRDCSDCGKKNQLDFIQSFVLDLRVNDLIDKRGFDMSLIAEDQIRGLEALRDLMMTPFVPPTRREPLVYALQIAGAVMEHKRWPAYKRNRLPRLLEFFEAATPEIYATAMELVEIVKRTGVDSKQAARKAMDECVSLGFRFTGDEFDLERDLEEVNLTECMQDKYPDELQGAPVQLKLETYRAQARLALIEEDNVASYTQLAEGAMDSNRKCEMGPARPTKSRHTHEPTLLSSAHVLPPAPGDPSRHLRGICGKHPVKAGPGAPFGHIPIAERPLVRGGIPDDYGRLPGDNGYNTCFPPGKDAFSQMQTVSSASQRRDENGVYGQFGDPWHGSPPGADQYGRMPGDPNYMMLVPPVRPATPQRNNPVNWKHAETAQALPPRLPWLDNNRGYMAGLTRSIAEARLAQQILVGSTNLYQYAENNPVTRVDPTGLASWIVVGRWWVKYDHAYIQFSNGFKCNGSSSFGFWPNTGGNVKCGSGSGSGSGSAGSSSNSSSGSSAGSSGSTASGPGTIQYPDPHEGDGSAEKTNNSPEFDAALCACIQQSLKHPPGYCFGKYVCGSWVASMWDCANAAIAKKRPNAR